MFSAARCMNHLYYIINKILQIYLIFADRKYTILNPADIKDIVNEIQHMISRHRYFIQAVLYPLRIFYICNGDTGQSHNIIHGSPYIMAHAADKL